MKNKKKKAWQFPNISRFITETKDKLSWDEKKHFIYLFIVAFLIFIVFMAIDLRQKITMTQGMSAERKELSKDIKSWEKVIEKHKDYRDGYLELAILEYRIGDTVKSKEYLNKALIIDPNSKEGRDLEKILLGKR